MRQNNPQYPVPNLRNRFQGKVCILAVKGIMKQFTPVHTESNDDLPKLSSDSVPAVPVISSSPGTVGDYSHFNSKLSIADFDLLKVRQKHEHIP